MNVLPSPAALKNPAKAAGAGYKQPPKQSLEAELATTRGRLESMQKRMALGVKRQSEVINSVVVTAEIQGAVFGASFLSGFMRGRGKSLKIWKVDLRWVVGGGLALTGIFLRSAASEHLLALGNGVLASAVSELAFDLGAKMGSASKGDAPAAKSDTPASTAAPAATPGVKTTQGAPRVTFLDDGGDAAIGRVDPDGFVEGALDPIERFNGEIALAKNFASRARAAEEAGNGEQAAELRGEARKHREYARNIHNKYHVGTWPEEWKKRGDDGSAHPHRGGHNKHPGANRKHPAAGAKHPAARVPAGPRQTVTPGGRTPPIAQLRRPASPAGGGGAATDTTVEVDDEVTVDESEFPAGGGQQGSEWLAQMDAMDDAEFEALTSEGVEDEPEDAQDAGNDAGE